MFKRLIALAVLIILASVSYLLAVPTAQAHVMVPDAKGEKGAIVHVMPDDDPIAGENTTIYFDTQGNLLEDGDTVALSIENEQGEKTKPSGTIDGSLVTHTYIFPLQGVYVLRYEIKTLERQYQFTHTIRVSRGVEGVSAESARYPLAEAALLGSGVLFMLLAILMWNFRHEIVKQSQL